MNGAVSKFETPITSHGLSLFIIICKWSILPYVQASHWSHWSAAKALLAFT